MIGSFYGLASNPYYVLPEGGRAPSQPRTWLDHRHPAWRADVVKWVYARDVYRGEVLDPGKIGSYLVRKKIGESIEAYGERQALADFTSHFGVCADALAGMLFNVEDDATRVFGDLGRQEDLSSTIGALHRNADGRNTGYKTIWKQLAIELVITHCHWVLLDVVGGVPRVVLVEPERVVDWGEDADGLAWVKVCESVQERPDWQAPPDEVKQYVLFTRTGWQRYRESGPKDKPTAEAVGEPGRHSYVDAAGKPQLPIFRVSLPLRRNVGFPLAKKNVALFNKESERDHLLRAANFPKLFVPADDDVFKKTETAIKNGAFVVQEDPNVSKSNRFDTPPTAAAEIATKVIDQKVEQFYKAFFREYADSAQEKTATEVRQDVASGVAAFLQMLKAALDDAENQALWRLEQAVFPNDSAKWFKARVERSANFQPLNPDEEIERLRTRYFGQGAPVPVDRKALKEVLRQVLAWDGIALDEAALEAALDNHLLVETKDLLGQLPIPPAIKARLSRRWAERLGVMMDDDEANEAVRIAETEQRGRELLAQPFGPSAGGGNDPPEPKPRETVIRRDGDGYRVTEG